MAAAEPRRLSNGARNVCLRQRDRFVERTAERQLRCKRSGIRASRPVHDRSIDARRAEFSEPVSVIQQVDDVSGREVAAFDEDG